MKQNCCRRKCIYSAHKQNHLINFTYYTVARPWLIMRRSYSKIYTHKNNELAELCIMKFTHTITIEVQNIYTNKGVFSNEL